MEKSPPPPHAAENRVAARLWRVSPLNYDVKLGVEEWGGGGGGGCIRNPERIRRIVSRLMSQVVWRRANHPRPNPTQNLSNFFPFRPFRNPSPSHPNHPPLDELTLVNSRRLWRIGIAMI